MTYSIDNLKVFGFTDGMIKIWRERGIEHLLPLQEKVLMMPQFFGESDIMVIAPTSSGKTLLAQILALFHLKDMKKVVYLVPTKALAEEKYKVFQSLFKPFGYKIAIATRDRPETDEIVFNNSYDLLIAVYEKLKSYTILKPEILNRISLLIADEIQILSDDTRGAMVDILLTKIIHHRKKLKTLFLSAVVGEPERFGNWLGFKPIIFTERPIELREGVFIVESGKFIYRNFNSEEQNQEYLFYDTHTPPDDPSDNYKSAHFSLAQYLSAELNEQVILFLPIKQQTIKWAHEFLHSTNFEPANKAIEDIKNTEDSLLKEEIIKCLRCGIAFHNSDLSQDIRQAIENGFESGEIRVLFSTSTLSQGVNIGGRNIICSISRIGKDEITGRTSTQNLLRSEFKNQGGRAGRFGKEKDFGRAIILASDKDEAGRILNEYILSPLEPLESPMKENDFNDAFLDLISSDLILSEEDWYKFLSSTYFYYSNINSSGFKNRWDKDIKGNLSFIVNSLKKDGLIADAENGFFNITGIGKITTAFGFNPLTTKYFHKSMLAEEVFNNLSHIDLIFIASSSYDGRQLYLPLRKNIDTPFNIIKKINQRFEEIGKTPSEYIKTFLSSSGGFTEDEIQMLKRTLVITDWISDISTADVEKSYGIHLGGIQNIAHNFEWLFHGWSMLAEMIALPPNVVNHLKTMALRIRHGVSDKGLNFAKLNIPEISRGHIQKLLQNGFENTDDIKNLKSSEELEAFLPAKIAESIYNFLHNIPKETITAKVQQVSSEKKLEKDEFDKEKNIISKISENTNIETNIKDDEIILQILESSPGMVLLKGRKIFLKPKSYQLLCLLAQHSGELCSYIKIDEMLWPKEKVEPQQISQHKFNIIAEFGKVLGHKKAEKLITVKTKHGLILNLPKEQIKFIH